MNLHLLALLGLVLVASALAVVFTRDLFAIMLLQAVYSGVVTVLLALAGAVDVAFTEAVVGTGLSTVFIMTLLPRVDVNRMTESRPVRRIFALAVALAVGGVMTYGVHQLPAFGDPESPAMVQVASQYVERAEMDMHTPNVVTAVLADYRSFDTLIETLVVVTAALSCLLILGRRRDEPTV